MAAKQTWFISHPSGGLKHTPTFFNAIDHFARQENRVAIVFPHTGQDEVQLTKQSIEQSDLVIVEVSIPSTGSGIELGWASAAGKSILAFHQGGSVHSPALKFVTSAIHVYVTQADIMNVLQRQLQ